MISPNITRSHSIGRAARANIGRDSRLFGDEGRPVEGVYYPYLPVKVPPNKLLQNTGVIPRFGYIPF
jgi:hypothetical protein